MAQYKVTGTFTVTTAVEDEGQVLTQARVELQDAARRANGASRLGGGWGWLNDGKVDPQVTIGNDDVTVERLPDPEPLITMTRAQLEAEIAACVAQAIAAQNPDQQKG
jgi:hypothetical protein